MVTSDLDGRVRSRSLRAPKHPECPLPEEKADNVQPIVFGGLTVKRDSEWEGWAEEN